MRKIRVIFVFIMVIILCGCSKSDSEIEEPIQTPSKSVSPRRELKISNEELIRLRRDYNFHIRAMRRIYDQ